MWFQITHCATTNCRRIRLFRSTLPGAGQMCLEKHGKKSRSYQILFNLWQWLTFCSINTSQSPRSRSLDGLTEQFCTEKLWRQQLAGTENNTSISPHRTKAPSSKWTQTCRPTGISEALPHWVWADLSTELGH